MSLNDQAELSDLLYDQEDLLKFLDEYEDNGLVLDQYGDHFNGQPGGTFQLMVWSCIKPSLQQMLASLVPLLFICVFQQAVVFWFKPCMLRTNRMFTLIGLAYLFHQFEMGQVVYLLAFTTCIYVAFSFVLTTASFDRAKLVTCFFIAVAIVSEVLAMLIFDKGFDTVRAIAMILTMKSISFIYYLNETRVRGKITGGHFLREFINYNGYLWNLSTSIHGPWIDQNQQIQSVCQQQLSFLPLSSVLGFFKALVCSSVALVFSNCLFDQLKENVETNSLLDLYLRAISFRFSNYFICFYTQSLLSINQINKDSIAHEKSIFSVVNPLEIEFPRSLSYVVTNWNLPMHAWLKKFIFVPTNRSMGLFASIFFTYFISSLLHGSNVKIAMVLLSFGFLTYSEYGFRKKLSKLIDSCVASKRCQAGCAHKRKATNPLTIAVNGLFYALNIYHLIYLGQIFTLRDSAGSEHMQVAARVQHDFHRVLDEWSMMGFMSHKINSVLFIAYFLLPN